MYVYIYIYIYSLLYTSDAADDVLCVYLGAHCHTKKKSIYLCIRHIITYQKQLYKHMIHSIQISYHNNTIK